MCVEYKECYYKARYFQFYFFRKLKLVLIINTDGIQTRFEYIKCDYSNYNRS